jgi:hypothetical protein
MSKKELQNPKVEDKAKMNSLEEAKERDSLNMDPNMPQGTKKPKMTMK